MQASLEMDNVKSRSGATDANITNRIQEIEMRLSGIGDTTYDIERAVQENTKG